MRIHILGGGIGGMSAALHLGRLSEGGCLPAGSQILIYEASGRLGGKSESQIADNPWQSQHWPGEHGFRFFPNFYRCITDTLAHIPLTDAHLTRRMMKPPKDMHVAGLLKETREGGIGINGRVHRIERAPSLDKLPQAVASMLTAFGAGPVDITRFAGELVHFLTTCHDRALTTWEHQTLRDLCQRNGFSPAMETLIRSLRALSAMRADRGSLRTLLFTATQMIADFDEANSKWDAILPGPTDYLMLEPWQAELTRLGVQGPLFQHEVVGLDFHPPRLGLPSRLSRVHLRTPGGNTTIVASHDDWFVLALPFEVARGLIDRAVNRPTTLDPVLGISQRPDNMGDGAEPMVGVQFFLQNDRPINAGHTMYPNVDWSMTSVSQAQFWNETFTQPLATVFGVPELRGVLSVIISAWDMPAQRLNGRRPQELTAAEIAREAFDQVAAAAGPPLTWADVIGWSVDHRVTFTPGVAHCTTPLWVSPAGSYLLRPKADPGCGNLFFASDWVRTETDVGSMESADEAARLAVQGIISGARLRVPAKLVPEVRPLRLWPAVEAMRAVDQWMFNHRLPHLLDVPRAARRQALTALSALRDGIDVNAFQDLWSFVQIGVGMTPEPVSWAAAAAEPAARAELDHTIRVLEVVESVSSKDDAMELEKLLSALLALE